MKPLRILLASLLACALVAVAFLLQTSETQVADRAPGVLSAIALKEQQELVAGDSAARAREDKGLPAEDDTPKSTIRGVALDDLGAPITTPFRIFAWPDKRSTRVLITRFEDPAGRFELTGYDEATWHIRATAKGYVQSNEVEAVYDPRLVGAELQLKLTRRPRIGGIVVTPNGTPVNSPRVQWRTPTEESNFQSSTKIVLGEKPGSFTVDNVQLGEFAIHAEHEYWVPSEAQSFTLRPGEERLNLLLTLRKGGRIEGFAYDREHSPARQLVIDIDALDLERHPKDLPTQTDDRGRFEASNLSPGFY